LYEIKNRSKDKPFSLLIADTLMLGKLGIRMTDIAEKYITRFWPGALTVIMEDDAGRKIGLRLPENDIARGLIRCSNVALACPSANLSGEEPSNSAIEVKKIFDGLIDLVIDDRIVHVGRESSIIDLTSNPPRLLREGVISRKELDNLYDNK
ncbi:MAG: L-threonylcarbamoyladenylate synthase, partial [Candidatus Omnitrophica bacterium]|nr:L-threonylcarbamoyladenylate synthase [Candidatus Omnitrophota bacterium]